MINKIQIFLTVLFLGYKCIGYSQQALIDPTFNSYDIGNGNGDGFIGEVRTSAIQLDGKILLGGALTNYNGNVAHNLIRLNIDGTIDSTFNIGAGFNDAVNSIVILANGQIIVVGEFTTFNGVGRIRIAALNTDGSLDYNYNPYLGLDDNAYALILQPDGKIIVGGRFDNFNGVSSKGIVRLNTNCTIDTSFHITNGFNNGTVHTLALQNDGKILAGGAFTGYNFSSIGYVARINGNGSFDNSFNSGLTINTTTIYAISVQSDGNILIGGEFTNVGGLSRKRIARLLPNGNLDATFNPQQGFNDKVKCIKVQADNSILVLGEFTSFNNVSANGVVKLQANGIIDTTFHFGNGFTGRSYTALTDPTLKCMSIQQDGNIIIGGSYSKYNNIDRSGIVRVFVNGELDISFNPGSGSNGIVRTMIVQPDSKVVIGGEFTVYNGNIRSKIARLNSDGTIDSNFNPNVGFNGTVNALLLQQDGKILVGGDFTKFNNYSVGRIARLDTNGNLDVSFTNGLGFDTTVSSLILQPDGKIIVGGGFYSYNNNPGINGIVRLNQDGSIDYTFNPGTGFSSSVFCLSLQNDGKILVGGTFTSFYGNFNQNKIARLNNDGTLDTSFIIDNGFDNTVYTLNILTNGKILVGGAFSMYKSSSRNRLALLNSNGSLDTSFVIGTGFNRTVYSCTVQQDGKYIVMGNFSSFNGQTINRIAKLNIDGSLDSNFNPGTSVNIPINANYGSHCLLLQSDGKIIFGGDFTNFNGIGRNRIFRVLNSGLSQGIIKNEDFNSVQCFPNPFRDFLTVFVKSDKDESFTLSISDYLGQQIYFTNIITNKTLILDKLNIGEGLYIMNIFNQNRKIETFKIIRTQ